MGEGQTVLQELKQGVGVRPVDVHLAKDGELGLIAIARPYILQALEDFIIGTIFLWT